MKIKVNGNTETIKDNMNILDFLKSKNLNPLNVVVEYNLNIVKSEKWNQTILKENDSLEILTFVGGG